MQNWADIIFRYGKLGPGWVIYKDHGKPSSGGAGRITHYAHKYKRKALASH